MVVAVLAYASSIAKLSLTKSGLTCENPTLTFKMTSAAMTPAAIQSCVPNETAMAAKRTIVIALTI